MKIGFYSSKPLEDKKNWSGTMFKMFEQMASLGYEIEWLPRLELSNDNKQKLDKIEKIFNQVFRRGYNRHVNIFSSQKMAKSIEQYLEDKKFDIIFVPTYMNDFANVKTEIPIIYLNDANVGQLLNYYPYYSGFGYLSKLETKYIEKKALKNFDRIIYSSEWAKNYAIEDYLIDREKIDLLKFGANLEVPKEWKFKKDISGKIQFLFLAVDWDRKRGDLAYRSLKILKDKGYDINFLILGCHPNIKEDWIEIVPFLNKNNANELEQIQSYLLKSHFLFVPTKADCTPIAFCEAAGYGLPIISTDTGGVSAHVENDKTGILLSSNSTEEDYSNKIELLLQNPEKIKEMSIQSRVKYENELNWEKWKKDFEIIIKNMIRK